LELEFVGGGKIGGIWGMSEERLTIFRGKDEGKDSKRKRKGSKIEEENILKIFRGILVVICKYISQLGTKGIKRI
jgi:hypothetical protein